MVREKSGNFVIFLKVNAKLEIFFNADFHKNLLLFLSNLEKNCQVIHQYESACVNFQELFYCLKS